MAWYTIFSRKTPWFPPRKYSEPDDFLCVAQTGNDTPTNSGDPRFTCHIYQPSGSLELGGSVTTNGGLYVIFLFAYGTWTGASSNSAVQIQAIENTGNFSSGKTYSGTVPSPNRRIEVISLDPDDDCGFIGATMQTGVPNISMASGAEWAFFMGQETTGDCQMEGGAMIVLPAPQPQVDDFADELGQSSFGNRASASPSRRGTWLVTGFANSRAYYSDTADTDTESENNETQFTLPADLRDEQWLIFQRVGWEKMGGFPTGTARTLRGDFELNGEPLFNVRTNNTTGGSTLTGRGYQIHYGLQNFNHYTSVPFVVAGGEGTSLPSLRVGRNTVKAIANPGESIGGMDSELDLLLTMAVRTSEFNQFSFIEDSNAVVVDSDTWQDSAFELTVDCDGTSCWFLGFSTTVHQFEGQVRFRISRDGSPLMTTGSDFPTMGKWDTDAFTDGSDGSGDTDNDTVPVTIFWGDIPSAGPHTYTVEYRRNSGTTGSNNAMFNTRDDGSDGYRGTFFAAELQLPEIHP